MKEPIKPEDIRKGDLIRWESAVDPEMAHEWRATVTGSTHGPRGTYYLIDRPAPAVELPTEPTFGLLRWHKDGAKNGPLREFWGEFTTTRHMVVGRGLQVNREKVLSFTPAVAVPVEALDALRKPTGFFTPAQRIDAFLAAVDEANEGAR